MRLDDVDEERAKLEEYRSRVLAELERRAEVVKRIDNQLASAEFQLEALAGSRRPVGGDTRKLLTQAALREKIKRDKVRLQQDRAQAMEDVRSARERLEQVEAEISESVTAGPAGDRSGSGDED